MLFKYNAKIKPSLYSPEFQYFDWALISRRRRILDKWFYFYINDPIMPIVVWDDESAIGYQIQPGTNRYIGTALRDNNEWIDAVYITNKADTCNTNELTLSHCIDVYNANSLDSHNITLDNPIHKWGIGDQTLYDPSWIPPVFDWIHKNLKYKWGLEYQGHVHYVNSERRLSSLFKKTKLIVHANDFLTVQEATKYLFDRIRLFEFRDL